MNTVFVKARKISKSLKGNRGSAVNYAKYILREMKGIDYTNKGEILASGIEGTQENPIAFWQKAEKRENQTKRKDTARFAKEYIMALPSNFPKNEMQNICENVAKILSKNNRVVQWAMHEPDKTEGSSEENFHCHFLMSEREYVNGVFAETKNREWNSKAFLARHKKEIGAEINSTLERLNLPKWSVEIGEGAEPKIDKTENQIRAERANKKNLSKAERKIKLAEAKINFLEEEPNGFGRDERQSELAEHADIGGTRGSKTIAEQIAEYDQRESERLRNAEAQRVAERNKKLLEQMAIGNRHSDNKLNRASQKGYSNGSRKVSKDDDWDIGY